MADSEHKIQNEVRNSLVGQGSFFRANVGQAWTGAKIKRLQNGDMLISEPRPFATGLPKGFSDLFGWHTVEITPEMVGQRVAVFTAIEVKSAKGKIRPEQERFLGAVENAGGRAGIARSAKDTVYILQGQQTQGGH